MRVLLIGSGGREHALAWAMARSKRLEKLYVAPGNGGTSLVAENIGLDVAGLASGLYLLTIRYEDSRVETHRIVVRK